MSGAEHVLDAFAELVAERVADKVIARLDAARDTDDTRSVRLLSLNELVELLPPTKSPETWRRWLYARLPRNEVPGATKLGGLWFFRPDETLAWIEGRDG